MSDPGAKSGPLTQAEIQSIWEGAMDSGYVSGFEESGEGDGFEAWTQLFVQLARVARAIDASTQEMFIRGWSGQTGDPAGGPAQATVPLTFARSARQELLLRLQAGSVLAEEVAQDYGQDGGVPTATGRRYALASDLFLLPGESGPGTVTAVAERPGRGYNNPFPGTISSIPQPGTQFTGEAATVIVSPGAMPPPQNLTVTLVAQNIPDMFLPDHVGQYVQFTAGANQGRVARVTTFLPPAGANGSSAVLETVLVAQASASSGTFLPGEQVQVKSGATVVGYGQLLAARGGRVALVFLAGAFAVADTLLGSSSGATATMGTVLVDPTFTPEVSAASWRVLDWAADLGVTVANPQSPQGGRLGMLDELGAERGLPRAVGEPDEVYRRRLTEVADVVTPNAVRRTLNRVLGDQPWCFREVGSALLPGFFYDEDYYDNAVDLWAGSGAGPGFAFDEPVTFIRGLSVVARGYYGGLTSGNFTFVYRFKGGPEVAQVGDIILGSQTGTIWTPSARVATSSVALNRFRTYFSYEDFRAYFMVGILPADGGDFGFSYDNHPHGAYDISPVNDFYDGVPLGLSATARRVWQAIYNVKAGGVGFDLYLETGACS